jgi:hypothetical protein
LLAVVLAHLGHVATDNIHNRLAHCGYFLTYRAFGRFDSSSITPTTMCSILTIPGLACFRLKIFCGPSTNAR